MVGSEGKLVSPAPQVPLLAALPLLLASPGPPLPFPLPPPPLPPPSGPPPLEPPPLAALPLPPLPPSPARDVFKRLRAHHAKRVKAARNAKV